MADRAATLQIVCFNQTVAEKGGVVLPEALVCHICPASKRGPVAYVVADSSQYAPVRGDCGGTLCRRKTSRCWTGSAP